MIQQFNNWSISQRNESRDSHRNLYTHVHYSIIHNCQNIEANLYFNLKKNFKVEAT